jgi:hypothetical protein
MELLIADALVLAAAVFVVRWARKGPFRAVPLIVALGATAVFVVARNRYTLQDSAFLWTLLGLSGGAVATTLGLALLLGRHDRDSLVYSALAGALVPVLFVVYIAARLTACLVTGCDLS